MPFAEAVWLALAQIRVQKLKSFFTLLGVCIGVMFLIAVISIVQGMSSYMENDFAAKMLGVNTFTLRRFPWFGDGASSEEEWRSWLRRPRMSFRSWERPVSRAKSRTASPTDSTTRRTSRNGSWIRIRQRHTLQA